MPQYQLNSLEDNHIRAPPTAKCYIYPRYRSMLCLFIKLPVYFLSELRSAFCKKMKTWT